VHKIALALISMGHGKVTRFGNFGYSDVNFCIANGPRCLKSSGPCLLDGSNLDRTVFGAVVSNRAIYLSIVVIGVHLW
jgi:hypothetical protein